MTGHHVVKTFLVRINAEIELPEGWKPFAVIDGRSGHYFVIARKWRRADET